MFDLVHGACNWFISWNNIGFIFTKAGHDILDTKLQFLKICGYMSEYVYWKKEKFNWREEIKTKSRLKTHGKIDTETITCDTWHLISFNVQKQYFTFNYSQA